MPATNGTGGEQAATALGAPLRRFDFESGVAPDAAALVEEQHYFVGQNSRTKQLLHGYGTVRGLQVTLHDRHDDTIVSVSPGLAIDPGGRSICVPAEQCASIKAWLDREKAALAKRFGAPPWDDLTAYVVLRYREVVVDDAGPRIVEGFGLSLDVDPPSQGEEANAVRFGRLLDRIKVADAPPFATSETILALVRELRHQPVEIDWDPVPPTESPLLVQADEATTIIQAAFRVWATEVLPVLACGSDGSHEGTSSSIDGVVLARLVVAVNADYRLRGESSLDDAERPILLNTRALQARAHVVPPLASKTNGTGVTDHGLLVGLGDDDHPQYLLADGARPLDGPLDAAGHGIIGLAKAVSAGNAVPFEQAVKDGDPAGGDLSGQYLSPKVSGLQGRPVDDASPSDGQVLAWSDKANKKKGAWLPTTPDVSDHDHAHYLRTDGTQPMAGTFDVGENHIVRLVQAKSKGHAVPYEQAVKVGDTAKGDLEGSYPEPKVVGLQGRSVDSTEPKQGDVLVWSPDEASVGVWTPRSLVPENRITVVAAGVFERFIVASGPVLNNLTVVRTAGIAQSLELRFDGYTNPNPDNKHTYIVKGTVIGGKSDAISSTVFEFVEFRAESILVRLRAAEEGKRAADGFMVEISVVRGLNQGGPLEESPSSRSSKSKRKPAR